MKSINEITKAIDLSVDQWPGNCYFVACAMVEAKLVRGKPRYGIYDGAISEHSLFAGRQVTRHGWIERRTTLVDPTRWVFESVEPYIYVGPRDNPDYDFGGNRLKKSLLRPPPEFDSTRSHWEVPKHLLPFIQFMLGEVSNGHTVCAWQLVWLSSLPLDMLGDHAKSLYLWVIDEVEIPEFIPIDNREFVLGLHTMSAERRAT